MAIARDASSPVRFNLSNVTTGGGTESGTSASFTPPANAWVYASACINSTAASPTFSNPTNTGGGLGSWSLVKSQANASGGSAAVWRAFVNSSVATTVTISVSSDGETAGNIPNDAAAWVDVWTGAATSQTGAATAGGTSTTTNFSPTITTTASGSQVAGVAVDWQAAGTPTSTDTIDGYTQTGQTSGGRAYKASNSGAPGSVALNFHSPGTPQWAYVLYEILAPSGGVSVNLTGQAITSTEGTPTATVSYAVAGRSITSTLGTITPTISYGAVGQAITSVLGTIVPTVSYGLTGQTATFTEGAITASQGGDVTLTLAGQVISSTLGTPTPTVTYSALGQTITSAEGTLSPQASYSLAGQSITFTEGATTTTVSLTLNGQTITSTEGVITAAVPGDVAIQLAGLSIQSALGVITATGVVPAGKHRRRFGVRDGNYLLVFDTRAEAEEAKRAIAARDLPKPKNARRVKVKPIPTPDEKISLPELAHLAAAQQSTPVYESHLQAHDFSFLADLYHELQRRQEEEDIALTLLHHDAEERQQHIAHVAHVLEVVNHIIRRPR